MSAIFGFMLEHSAGYLPDLILAALVISFVVGSFIKNRINSPYFRSAIYSFLSVFIGLSSYSRNSIPNRSIELMEAITLGIAMFIVIFLIVTPVVVFKNRKKS